ncbi:MAG: NAD(P)-dependent oxidoreductase, partial [Acidimicrobiales bacterium]
MGRILVTEKIATLALDRLRRAGHDVDVRTGLDPGELIGAVPSAAALIIRSATQVTAEVIDAAADLVVVGRAGIGLDNVDVAHATDRGVIVVNAPRANAVSAAEHTMALILAQARNIPQAHAALVAGRWERQRWQGVELAGKTLGVIGLGQIGALVAARAQAFSMEVVAFDPYVTGEQARTVDVELVALHELAARADFITLHLATTPDADALVDT